MEQNHLILISRKPEDTAFAVEVAKALEVKVSLTNTKEKLREHLHSRQGCAILMDFDPLVEREAGFRDFQEVALQIEKMKAWHRVIAISGYALNDVITQGKFTAYSKYMLRTYTPQSVQVYTYVIQQMLISSSFDKPADGINDLQIQRTRINDSAKKAAAIEALGVLLSRCILPARVSKAVVRATDELILNAVFDAPINQKGIRYKQALDRGSPYAVSQLSKREEVELELISTKNFLQISVTDYFGSLRKEDYLSLLEKNLKDTKAKPDASGLGLYLTVTTGLSIQILIDSGKRTKVSLVVPWVESVRELKYAFRFFCLKQR